MGDEQRLAEIRARADAATPGPWDGEIVQALTIPPRICGDLWSTTVRSRLYPGLARRIWSRHTQPTEGDLEFIAHARSDVPWLLERIAALEAERAVLMAEVDAGDQENWVADPYADPAPARVGDTGNASSRVSSVEWEQRLSEHAPAETPPPQS